MSRIAVTLGDPAGIGPEVVAGALAAVEPALAARVIVFGHHDLLHAAARAVGVALPTSVEIRDVGAAPTSTPGQPDAASGAAQVAYLHAAVDALRDGTATALATAPISKTWARRAGLAFPGHTEFLADAFAVPQVTMMFAGPRMRVALATVHVPLAHVATTLTAASLLVTIRQLAASLRDDHGVAAPRVGVVGLNPHAGEGGLLGDDEARLVAPAIAAARAEGIDAHGPLVPDAAFRDHLGGATDGLVALYHDQGLIPVKLIDFDEAVNVTLGLPIVRTSPDHGTAYDLAGSGRARATSMQAALELAARIQANRARAVRRDPTG